MMYTMLIVDDEPEIVDSLFELFMGECFPELDIIKTYSSKEAVAIVNTVKIDILLTDIRMPGTNGLQLAEIARNNWPKCRVIFLSGYNEFDYAYTAIKGDCEDYILKTENNREIIKSIKNVLEKLEKSFQDGELMSKARTQMKLVIPLLRKELVLDIVKGVVKPSEITQEKLDELEITLKKGLKANILFCRVDEPSQKADHDSKESEYMMAIKLILEEALSRYANKVVTEYDNKSFICLIQGEPNSYGIQDGDRGKYIEDITIIKGLAETAQNICRESLNTTLSFTLSSETVGWDMLNSRFLHLKKIMDFSSGIGTEAFLTDKSFSNGLFDRISSYDNDFMENKISNIQKANTLVKYLESGMKDEYFKLLSEILDCIRKVKSKHNNLTLEIYYSISICLLSYINRWKIADVIAFKTGLYKLTRADEHRSWNEAVEYIYEMSNAIFDTQKNDQDQMADASIKYIQQYIQTHLSEQLSLTRLAELVYFNPSYLSRLFKKVKGMNLSDYIIEARIVKAKTLLRETDLKIQELAEMLGMESATYFGRVFRKITNMTPQEYRESIFRR